MLARIKLRYAMRLALAAAAANPSPCQLAFRSLSIFNVLPLRMMFLPRAFLQQFTGEPLFVAITSKVVFSDQLFDAPRFGLQKGSFPFRVFLI